MDTKQSTAKHKTKHKTQQEIELHNPTMGVTINNESTTTESLLQMTQCGSNQRPLDHLKSSTLPQSYCAPPNRYTGYNVLCCVVNFFRFCCFTSQVNSYGHCGTVSSPNHTFSWAGLNKRLTSNSCTYFRL